ncbi:MAG: hypothetical protein IPM95_05030 [Sphingobacteriales bacterium]|nr:hypothetical protein [Sphingobacteriales bacterium]
MKIQSIGIVSTIVILSSITGCMKENITVNTTPVSMIIQRMDTTVHDFVTVMTLQFHSDTDPVYYDSITYINPNGARVTQPIDFSFYSSLKCLIVNSSSDLDTSRAPVIKLDNSGRIIELHDYYNLFTNETASAGDWSNNGFFYQSFSGMDSILSGFRLLDAFGSINSNSLQFQVVSANQDSMIIHQGNNHDMPSLDAILKYKVIFEDEQRNTTGLMSLSGYAIPYSYPSNTSNLFGFVSALPLPKLNNQLARVVYASEYMGNPVNLKCAEFTYEFDDQNRVTSATIQYYLKSLLNPDLGDIEQRILFNY